MDGRQRSRTRDVRRRERARDPALFIEPGTYVLQLAASDGYLTVADRATIIVDPEPNLTGASLVVALGSPSPLTTGTTETVTATLRDAASAPIDDFPIELTVAGAEPDCRRPRSPTRPASPRSRTRASATGTDQIHATAFAPTFQLDSSIVPLDLERSARRRRRC